MKLNRREALKLGAAFAVLPSMLTLTGCGSVQSYINIVIGAVKSILGFIGGALATQITAALSALQTAVAGWKSGTITQDVVQALSVLQAVLDTIPLGNLVTGLISIAITAIDAILGVSGAAAVTAQALRPARQHPAPNVTVKTHKQFAQAWNTQVDAVGLPTTVKVGVPLF